MKTQIKRRNESLVNVVRSYGLFLATLVFAVGCAIGQNAPDDSGARRVVLGDGSKTKVIAYSKTNNKLYLDLEKEKPEGDDVKYYLLIDGVWMPTTGWKKGDMLWSENEVIPLDDQKIGNNSIMDYRKRDSLRNHMPLEVNLYVERKVKVNSNRDTVLEVSYTNSFLCFGVNDTVMGSQFRLVVDTILFDESLAISDSVGIDAELMPKLSLPVIDSTIATDTTFDHKLDHLVQVIHADYVPTFIHEAKVKIITEIDEAPVQPVEPKNDCKNMILWIIGAGILALLILCGILFGKKIVRLFENRKPSRKVEFDSDKMKDVDKVDENQGVSVDEENDSPKTPQDAEINKNKTKEELEEELGKYKEALGELVSLLRQEGINDKLTLGTTVQKLKERVASLKKEVTQLKEVKKRTEETSKGQEKKISQLESSIQTMKDNPESLENVSGYSELAKLIKTARKANSIKKDMEQNPNTIDHNTPTGILISKGLILDECLEHPDKIISLKIDDKKLADQVAKSQLATQVKKSSFIDKAKDNVKMIADDHTGDASWLKGSELMDFIEYVNDPEAILQSKKTGVELYKLVYDLKNVIKLNADQDKTITTGALSCDMLKKSVENLMKGYNHYRQAKEVALKYGSDKFDTSGLEKDVQQVFDDANRYLSFETYKNYWKNIVSPLYETLDTMYKYRDDEKHNIRALMFYSSQLYSIAIIMNEIHGNRITSTTVPKLNVSLFNDSMAPPPTQYGFPLLDEGTMNKECRFQYRGRDGEDDRVDFLKQYAPMPFIFISSYYDNNILSK